MGGSERNEGGVCVNISEVSYSFCHMGAYSYFRGICVFFRGARP